MLEVRIIYSHWLPKLVRVNGMVVYPFILLNCPPEEATSMLLKHEFIHVYQVRKVGFIKFYLSYFYEYLLSGYWDISYETEAYERQFEPLTPYELSVISRSKNAHSRKSK